MMRLPRPAAAWTGRLRAKSSARTARRARSGRLLAALLVLVVVAGLGAAGWIWYPGSQSTTVQGDLVALVERGPFTLNVTEKGELESSGNMDLRCEVKSSGGAGTAILKIVPEGTRVKAGDFVAQLDSSRLDDELTQQQIAVNASEALVVQAVSAYETAQISLREYLEGTFRQEKQAIQSEIFVAEENLRRAQQYLLYSRRLAAAGYITQLQLDADSFSVDNAANALDTARTKLNVLEEFTRAKMVKQLESDVASTKAQWEAQKKSHELELAKLKEIEDQLAKCTILAPSAGQVKYAHKIDSRGNIDFLIEEGAVVRERQVIVSLPDPAKMQVKVSINESLLGNIREGMPATIRSVALDDTLLAGHVMRISQYSEPTSWRRGNVKEFAAYVQVDDIQHALLPGMSAEVTIHCLDLADALKVLVQAVYAHGDETYCIVRSGAGWEARKVAIGANNEVYAVIEEGLKEKDEVALNPRSHLEQVDLPSLTAAEQQQLVKRPRKAGSLVTSHTQPTGNSASSALAESKPAAPDTQAGAQTPGIPRRPSTAGDIFQRLDKDGDGRLTADEWPQPLAERLQAADANGDGALDRGEMARAMARLRAAAPGGPPGAAAGGAQ